MLVLEGDPCAGTESKPTSWTRRCLRAADAVLLVVDSDNDIMHLENHFGPNFFNKDNDSEDSNDASSWFSFSSWFGTKANNNNNDSDTTNATSPRNFNDPSSTSHQNPKSKINSQEEATHWAAALGGELGQCLRWAKYQVKPHALCCYYSPLLF